MKEQTQLLAPFMELLALRLRRSVYKNELMEISDKWKLPETGWQVRYHVLGIVIDASCQKGDDDDGQQSRCRPGKRLRELAR